MNDGSLYFARPTARECKDSVVNLSVGTFRTSSFFNS